MKENVIRPAFRAVAADHTRRLTGAPFPHAVEALLEAADSDSLLRDAPSLAAGLTDAGWAVEVESGRFGVDDWHLLSSAWAPNVAVFFEGHEDDVRLRAQALASILSAQPERWTFRADGDDWSGWSLEDSRWTTGDWMATHPLEWHGGGVVVSLYVRPDYRPGTVLSASNLELFLERADTPADGLPRDDERSRRVAREGSVVDRWYLAGEHELPDDVIAALENDPDSRVRAAAESERWYRERTVIGPPPVAEADEPGSSGPPARFTAT